MATALKTVGETSAATIGPHVYQAIADVQGELAKTGIAKTRRNQQGSGYNFRGIDDVYAALSPLLAAHRLVIMPRMLSREVVERQSKSGGNLFYVTVHAEFDFVSAVDGSQHSAATFGEAMDSGDKATNKAMSAAYKYAAFMTFAIPTEGDNDADATTHDVAARSAPSSAEVFATGGMPAKPREKLSGPYTSKSALWAAVRAFVHEINGMGDLGELIGYLETPGIKALFDQCERDAPGLLRDGLPETPEYVPIEIVIHQRKRDLEQVDEMKPRNPITAG